jgi:hypothetical protein
MHLKTIVALGSMAAFAFAAPPVCAEGTAPAATPAPLLWKVTSAAYFVPGAQSYDLNVRYKAETFAAWIGAYSDSGGHQDQFRLGGEYDFQRGAAVVVPTFQVATHGLVAGQLYSEFGTKAFAVVGISRTDLRPFYNLSWDPNESAQLGVGVNLGAEDRLTGFTIFDMRLHTGQQNTHFIWRHRFGKRRLTADLLAKSGDLDTGRYARGVGATVTYDFPRWFVRAADDPYVNFSAARMIRLSAGCRF